MVPHKSDRGTSGSSGMTSSSTCELFSFFFFQAEDGIRDLTVTGVQTCALPICSSCVYPRLAPQPIKEEYLLTGPLEPTNEWYAIAKIAGIKMAQAYRRQYGFRAIDRKSVV